jgi:hypothetical protein
VLTGVVCYIERTPGGSGLRRVRLVGPELDQSWSAPSLAGDDPGRPAAPGEQLAHLRSAAAWIAEELAPVRELAAICLDAEGGVCSWISAPSADPQVVLAAIRQIGAPATSTGEPAAVAAGFGLLPDDAMGLASARSVQALAAPEQTGGSGFTSGGKGTPSLPRRRLGVLSVADAPVRVLIDELDALKIGVGSVISFWHAAALAWDPSVERTTARDRAQRNGAAETSPHAPIVVEPDAPVTATVIIDPAGRLTWSWSKSGELLAAGAMRLRTHTYNRVSPVAAAAPADLAPLGADEADLAPATRRLMPEDAGETMHAAECAPGDVGRLVMDWLSWSVQIGRTPDRIVCIGPATLPARPVPGEPAPTPSTLAETLGASWPSASIDAAIHDDPIGATLNRLRVLPMFQPARSAGTPAARAEDPRLSLVTLTSRPGRLDRTMHIWATLAILGAAAAVFIYAQRLGSGIENLRTRTAAVQARRIELLQSAEGIIPALSKSPDPVGMLSGKIQEYSDQISRLTASKPLLPLLLPAIEIFKEPEFADVQITTISASDIRLLISFTVAEADDLIPSAIRTKLDERFGVGVWDGNWGTSSRGRRPYDIFWVNPGGKR